MTLLNSFYSSILHDNFQVQVDIMDNSHYEAHSEIRKLYL